MNGIMEFPTDWSRTWTLSNLRYELKRRGIDPEIINQDADEAIQHSIMSKLISADAFIRRCKCE